jgi:uncharacterized SAM-binding protein YcdF (DUF218 family)
MILLRSLLFLLLIAFVAAGALATDIYAYASASDSAPADAAIVLGAAVWNGRPSPVFRERINHAISLYRAGRVKALIFTGGVGQGDMLAESVVASAYAVQQGVPTDDVFAEMTSRFTHENLRGAKAIVEQQHLNRVLIVSDPLHMRRAVTIARDMGLDAHPSPTPTTRYISLRSQFAFLQGEVLYFAGYLLQRPFMVGG